MKPSYSNIIKTVKRTSLMLILMMASVAYSADLSTVPQFNETEEQRDERMQWFRDAKFGMFIHWGPCSVGQKEIGWGRRAPRPWDVREKNHGLRSSDPEYDNYYKEFNPVHFNAEEWVQFAKDSGMKYIVMITKHHDGFSMFDSAVTDYDIMSSPFQRNIIGEMVAACHKLGMRFGVYYSTRDWYHEDYLVGDNKKYDAWYREQIRELLGNYGKIDIMWFDHVGGNDWSKWDFAALFQMMYTLQPDLIVNNRAAKFCGFMRKAEGGEINQPDPKIVEMTKGDYDTPEGNIGAMDIEKDWESCIHVGKGWAYRGEDGFKGPEDCIRMLVSCTTGGGNLLLNFGPRPDGTFADGEANVAVAMGDWLEKYGEAIYGTRGGPYRNGSWGGSCHKGNKLYLHLYKVPKLGAAFDPVENKVLSARTLTGGSVEFSQSDSELLVKVAEADQDHPVTVVELTMENPVVSGRIIGGSKLSDSLKEAKGKLISEKATLIEFSSISDENRKDLSRFFSGKKSKTPVLLVDPDERPWATVDLGAVQTVTYIEIDNASRGMTKKLNISVSVDGEQWEDLWTSAGADRTFQIPVTRFHAGIHVPGRDVRYIKLTGINEKEAGPLALSGMKVYGE